MDQTQRAEQVPDLGPSARPGVRRLVQRHRVETLAVTALLAAAALWTARADVWLMTALVCLSPVMAAAAVIDARHRRIPTMLTRAGFAVGVAVFVAGAVVSGDGGRLVRAGAAAAVVGLVYLVLWRVASMGLGDVRLAVVLGLVAGWAGWPAVVMFVVLAHLLMVPLAVWRLARGKRGDLPFGPAPIAGLYLACVLRGVVG
jgi:leader peptidase (prepilin peptidase) / N-methyltransferase